MKPVIIGVAGGSGSGKTTVVNHIIDSIGEDCIQLLEHDAYYHDQSHISFEERLKVNYDHPSSLETELMIDHISNLVQGKDVEIPIYDFAKHTRSSKTKKGFSKEIILVDGILIFSEPKLRDLMSVKIFVDTDDDVRLLRRLQRDIQERGRSMESVLTQYENYVRPMHLEFVEPSKRYADVIIPRGGRNKVALEMVLALINEKITK